MTYQLILASSSPRRRELVSRLGIAFTIIKPEIDERQHPGESALDYVRRLSLEKAEAVTAQARDATVLAADTIVVLGADTLGIDETGEVLGKPVTPDEARAMLGRLRGRTHQVYTAITLIAQGEDRQIITDLARTDVTMRAYSDAEIEAYIATGDPFDKAGSYAIQHPVFKPVARLDGCYTNVVGLPVCRLKDALARIGWPGMQVTPECDCGV